MTYDSDKAKLCHQVILANYFNQINKVMASTNPCKRKTPDNSIITICNGDITNEEPDSKKIKYQENEAPKPNLTEEEIQTNHLNDSNEAKKNILSIDSSTSDETIQLEVQTISDEDDLIVELQTTDSSQENCPDKVNQMESNVLDDLIVIDEAETYSLDKEYKNQEENDVIILEETFEDVKALKDEETAQIDVTLATDAKKTDITVENQPEQNQYSAQEAETEKNQIKAGEIIDEMDPKSNIPFGISITFRDEAIADMYKAKFIKFINNFVELKVHLNESLTINIEKDDLAAVNDKSEAEITDTPSKKRKKKNKAKKELFTLDVNPSSQDYNLDVKYTSKFTVSSEKNEKSEPKGARAFTCFNCGGAHLIRDCNEPRNFDKIRAAKQKMQRTQSKRYHLEPDHVYSHIAPGKVSPLLRSALGLAEDELPPFIYSMRVLGYPPGWIEEAKIVSSELDMFDIHGKNVKSLKSRKVGFDPDKIIEFIGFNAPIPHGTIDEYRRYNAPRFISDCNKESLLAIFSNSQRDEDDNTSIDMEIDEEYAEEGQNAKSERVSPTLVDLEQQKKELLSELSEKEEEKEEETAKSVKISAFGTPIIKSSSPYTQLPNSDNFSKDISPVINFENLPNSTGKYEKITDVLDKVRTTLKKIEGVNV